MQNKLIFNPKTGEKYDVVTKVQASEALKETVKMEKKLKLLKQNIKEFFKDDVDKALESGEKIAGFWEVGRGRKLFDKVTFDKKASTEEKRIYAEAKETIDEIESKYLRLGEPFMKSPRFGW